MHKGLYVSLCILMRCIFQCRSMSGGLQFAHVSLHMLVSPVSVSCSGQQLHDELVQSYVYVYIYIDMFLHSYLIYIYICTEHYWASLVYATYRYVLQVCKYVSYPGCLRLAHKHMCELSISKRLARSAHPTRGMASEARKLLQDCTIQRGLAWFNHPTTDIAIECHWRLGEF